MTNILFAILLSSVLHTNDTDWPAQSGLDWYYTNQVKRIDVVAYTLSNRVEIITNVVLVMETVRRFNADFAWKEVPLETNLTRRPLSVPDVIKTRRKVEPLPLPPGLNTNQP